MTDKKDIWIEGIASTPSPNCDFRPRQQAVDLLVIHNISLPPNIFEGDAVEDFFLNKLDHDAHPFYQEIKNVKVSAHFFIRRDGRTQQFVPINRRAWHAGESSFCGQKDCNDFSIGIELEGSDETTFTGHQYSALSALTKKIQQHYPAIDKSRITGHSDIAPGRKTDPGPYFNWDRYREQL